MSASEQIAALETTVAHQRELLLSAREEISCLTENIATLTAARTAIEVAVQEIIDENESLHRRLREDRM